MRCVTKEERGKPLLFSPRTVGEKSNRGTVLPDTAWARGMKLGKASKVEGSSYLHSSFETEKRPHFRLLHINPRGSSMTRQREVIRFNFRIG